jgi:prolyl-tRNA synthetase
VAEFTGLPAASQMKSLVMVADGEPVLALVRGDHQMSGTKLSGSIGALEVRPASAAEIIDWFGAEPGSLGPVGVTRLRIIADFALQGRRNMISGANRTDYHLRNVTPGRDFQPEFADIRRVGAGDRCLTCDAEMTVQNMAELGRIAKVANTGLKTQGQAGAEIPIPMGSYSLEFEPILRAAAAQNHDANGLRLPPGIAPFDVIVTPVNNADAGLREAAERIAAECESSGIEVLYDDRDERPGVKFKDADLIGAPFRITLGSKKLALGLVELYDRKAAVSREVPAGEAVRQLRNAK